MANTNEVTLVSYVKTIAAELKSIADELSKIRKVLESGNRTAVAESRRKPTERNVLISESSAVSKDGKPVSEMTDEDYLERIRFILSTILLM